MEVTMSAKANEQEKTFGLDTVSGKTFFDLTGSFSERKK